MDELTLHVCAHQCHFPVAQGIIKSTPVSTKLLLSPLGEEVLAHGLWVRVPLTGDSAAVVPSCSLSSLPTNLQSWCLAASRLEGTCCALDCPFPPGLKPCLSGSSNKHSLPKGSARLWVPLLRLRVHSTEHSPGCRTVPARALPDSTAQLCCRLACSSIKWWQTGRERFAPRSGKGGKRVIYPAKKSVFSGRRQGPR